MSDDDDLQLSASTLAALQSFMSERDEQQKRFEGLQAEAEKRHSVITMADFEEDWQQSQFWYDDDTALQLAQELLDGATKDTKIAVVSAPSVFVKLQELKSTGAVDPDLHVRLLEFDQRFAIFRDDFVHYDFNAPLRLPAEMKGRYDRVLVDPPFLSEDCQTKTALTVRWMTKPWAAPNGNSAAGLGVGDDSGGPLLLPPPPRIILCTGERMRELVERLYKPVGLRATAFEVRHTNQLGNEFMAYSSYSSRRLAGLDA